MKNIVLTFDDGCRNQLTSAVPLLKKYDFNATFFISRPQKWLDEAPDEFMTEKEITELASLGFDIGNHTLCHSNLRNLDDDSCRKEIRALNDLFTSLNIPSPVSFAYPGGPYAENAAAILPEFGLKCARTTEHALWDLKKTDPMRVPCFAICDKDIKNFDTALQMLEENSSSDVAAVILYHGVPDIAHPWCSTEFELFSTHMKFLYDNKYNVISMKDFIS